MPGYVGGQPKRGRSQGFVELGLPANKLTPAEPIRTGGNLDRVRIQKLKMAGHRILPHGFPVRQFGSLFGPSKSRPPEAIESGRNFRGI